MLQLSTLADRVWYAYHCLKRDADGELPSYLQLEREWGLPQGTFTRTVTGQRRNHRRETFPKLAKALRVTEAWLDGGDGDLHAPTPTGPVPPRPGTRARVHGDLPGWREAEEVAKQGAQIVPPEAFRAGAKMPIYRHVDHVTPRLVLAVAYYAWQTSTKAEQIKHSTAEGRAASTGASSHRRRRVS